MYDFYRGNPLWVRCGGCGGLKLRYNYRPEGRKDWLGEKCVFQRFICPRHGQIRKVVYPHKSNSSHRCGFPDGIDDSRPGYCGVVAEALPCHGRYSRA